MDTHYRRVTTNEELRDGPLKDRRCTDVFCFLVFLVFIAAMVVVGVFGFMNGDPALIIYPHDSSGNQCGRPGTPAEKYPLLYFVDPDSTKFTVCVKECPQTEAPECLPNNWVVNCKFTVKHENNKTEHIDPVDSVSFIKKVCLPEESKNAEAHEAVLQDFQDSKMVDYLDDLANSWLVLVGVVVFSVVLSLVFMFLLRYLAGVVVWASILIILAAFTLFGLYMYWESSNTKYSSDNQNLFLGLGIASWVLGFIALVLFIFMFRKIELAIAIVKSAALFISETSHIVLFPLVMFFVSVGIYAYWVLALLYLYSSGEMPESDRYSPIAELTWNENLRNAFYFELVGILWINSFKIALTQFVVSYSVCVWYFNQNRDSQESKVCRGLGLGLFYHIGSLAFGSFVLAVVWLVKFVVSLLAKTHREAAESNPLIKCICGCMACFVSCFERLLKFLDHQAYIRIALTGEPFCEAARNAFDTIISHASDYIALGGVGAIFQTLGRVLITVVSSYLGYFAVTHYDYYTERLDSPVMPLIVFVLFSYLVSSLFLSVYEMASDTIIQAYLLDESLNNGSTIFAPEPLLEFMQEHGHKIKKKSS